MEVVTINAETRTETGKKANKQLRKDGQVPCVLYGGDEVVHFFSHKNAFRSIIYSPQFKIAEINVGGKVYKGILKDMQFHPVTENITHLDFIELVPNKKVTVEIPLQFVGQAPGVKEGGKLMELVRRIKVKTTPENIVDVLNVDISELVLGSSVRVRDIQIPDGMEVINNPSIPVGSVEIPRALRSADAESEDAAEGESADAAEAEDAEAGKENS